jgi:hypothetical protein
MDLRQASSRPGLPDADVTHLYLLDDEWAAKIVNRTEQAVMHVG